MRTTFFKRLLKHAKVRPNLSLLIGDLGYSVVENFAEELPKQFENVGVAEQNMAGVAAGLASEGHHVFTYSIANFSTFRAAEQLRNDVDYHKLPVTTVIVGGGLAYGNLGYSHHAIQDFAFIRTLPNTLILAPGDPAEVSMCTDFIVENPQPSYLRLGKNGEPQIHQGNIVGRAGDLIQIASKGNALCTAFVGTGTGLSHALTAFEAAESGTLYSLPIWGFGARCDSIIAKLQHHQTVRTFETHLTDAGFGSWVVEGFIRSQVAMPSIAFHGYNREVLGEVGSQAELEAMTSLNFNNVR